MCLCVCGWLCVNESHIWHTTWLRHVTHLNVSRHAYACGTSHMTDCITSKYWLRHVSHMTVSRRTGRQMSHMIHCVTSPNYMRHITHVNESRHKCTKRQRSRRWCVWMSHVSHMTVSRHTWMSHVAHTRMSHVAHARMSHVTRRHASYSETIGASAPRIVLDFGYFK